MSENSNKPFVLVDGSSYLFRAYHAMPELTNSRGEATGTIYGVINMLRRLLTDYDPEHIAVVFDAKGKTFRNDMYPQYKANRPPMPDDLREQIQPVHEIIKAMGLPLLCIDGVEADDVIGTLAQQATAKKMDTLISTGDKDMAQLVNEHVHLINTMTNTHSDAQAVTEKFGVGPELIIDYLALVGDTSDNVPGVPKVGPKTAVKWLTEYGDLDTVIKRAAEVKGKVGESLRDSLEQLPLSRELVTIKCDVELESTPENLTREAIDKTRLQELYARYEFKNWLAELQNDKAASTTNSAASNAVMSEPSTGIATGLAKPGHYETIFSQQELDNWLSKLEVADVFAFDLETTSLDYMQAEIVGVSFAVKAGEAAYVPLAHDYDDVPAQLDRHAVLQQLKPLLEDPSRSKLGQNLKY
ncbi:MAG: DNA polymerase I, partial [Gammaproteobacteria bacterium]|nr:DNA polymerase I [Gammaproteobacteria bacterium]